MRTYLWPAAALAFALALCATPARAADDEDDDPKARHAAPATKKPVEPKPPAKPLELPKAKPEPKPAPEAKPEARVEPKHEEPHKKTEGTSVALVTPRKGKAPEPKPIERAPAPAAEEGDAPVTGRAVRVRLLDGSTVVGQVRAELSESLVIDCSLGQLTIPRGRISTIAYDAAAGLTPASKRAPVQQLDDGDLPRKK